jgi:hypothetical protein
MRVFKTVALGVGASLALAACAECPKSSEYDKVPYRNTRTAGEGLAVYGTHCQTPVKAQEAPVAQPVPAAPAPAPEPPVFRERQTK